MKILFFILFLFNTSMVYAKEIQYICGEWELELPEYALEFFFTEKRGTPFIGLEENDQFFLKDHLENMQLLNFIGWFNDTIRIYTSYSSEFDTYSLFFLNWSKDDNNNINKNELEIMKFSYITEWTYKTNCLKN